MDSALLHMLMPTLADCLALLYLVILNWLHLSTEEEGCGAAVVCCMHGELKLHWLQRWY